jgi:two-component system, sensor histidine kinase
LAASQALRHKDFAEFWRQAEASLALRQSGNILLFDRSRQELVNTTVPFGTPLPKAAVPEAERAFVTGKPQVTGLFLTPVLNQLLVAIIVPVQIDGDGEFKRAEGYWDLARRYGQPQLDRRRWRPHCRACRWAACR